MTNNKKEETSGLKVFAIVMSIGWIFNLIGVIVQGHASTMFALGTLFVIGLWIATIFE